MARKRQPHRTRKSARVKQSRSMMTFNVIALVVVAALVFGTLGAIVVDELLSGDDGSTIEFDPDQMDETEQQYLDRIEANPNDADAMQALAAHLENQGRIDEAIQWVEKALLITPNDMQLRLYFASILASAGKPRDAEVQYLRVVEAQPTNGAALLGLARLYRSWSPPRVDDAVEMYKRTVAVGGDSYVVQLAREELAEFTGGTPAPLTETSPVVSPQASSGT